jgi:hypothetical protein
MNPHGRCAEAADGQGPRQGKLRLLGRERQTG